MTTNNDAESSLLLTPKASSTSSTPGFSTNKQQDITNGDVKSLKLHFDQSFAQLQEQSQQNFDKLLQILEKEAIKRTALEQRLHSQLLSQSESMIALELKLLKLEAKVERRSTQTTQQTTSNNNTTTTRRHSASSAIRAPRSNNTNEVAVISSGASLTSGVTEDEGENVLSFDGSDSTPTFGSRPHFGTTIESIINNPRFGEASFHGESTRATRGDDGNSSLATSVTGSTLTSTVITRGGEGLPRLPEAVQYPSRDGRRDGGGGERPRSRSQSPLTVQSSVVASEADMLTDAAAAGSILSNIAVAPARLRRTDNTNRSSSLANRVVTFTADVLEPQYVGDGTGDSITMPDELDNDLSEVVDSFANSSKLWREEYEARLDALQKKWRAE